MLPFHRWGSRGRGACVVHSHSQPASPGPTARLPCPQTLCAGSGSCPHAQPRFSCLSSRTPFIMGFAKGSLQKFESRAVTLGEVPGPALPLHQDLRCVKAVDQDCGETRRLAVTGKEVLLGVTSFVPCPLPVFTQLRGHAGGRKALPTPLGVPSQGTSLTGSPAGLWQRQAKKPGLLPPAWAREAGLGRLARWRPGTVPPAQGCVQLTSAVPRHQGTGPQDKSHSRGTKLQL